MKLREKIRQSPIALQRVHSEQSGFSLIELLVVVLIIGILASVMTPRFIAQRDAAANQAAVATLTNAESAVSSYFTLNGQTFGIAGDEGVVDSVVANMSSNAGEKSITWVWADGNNITSSASDNVKTSGNANNPAVVYVYAAVGGNHGGVVLCVGSKGTKNYCSVVFGNEATQRYTITGDANGFGGPMTSNEFGDGSGAGILEGGSPSTPASFQAPNNNSPSITWTQGGFTT